MKGNYKNGYDCKKDSTASRAESLAARIELGAAGLAAFAEGLSEAECRTPEDL